MKYLLKFILFFAVVQATFAHSPELSNMMIYQQNGKTILLIRSSLTAFEGEIEYGFGKNSYKTPDEFKELVIKHFQKKCLMIINGDTIRFKQLQIQLGHETNLFAELSNMPDNPKSMYIKNSMFSDFNSSLCEVIISIGGIPNKQLVLSNVVDYQTKLKLENKTWIVQKIEFNYLENPVFILGSVIIIFIILFFVFKKNIKQSFFTENT